MFWAVKKKFSEAEVFLCLIKKYFDKSLYNNHVYFIAKYTH